MKFRVGPHLYRLQIRKGLVDADGVACDGLCDWEQRIIWLDADVSRRRRLTLLAHELRHAWTHDLGRATDEEGDANQVASFAVDFMRQVLLNGGELALMRLSEDGVVDSAAAPAQSPAEPRSAQCPTCNGYLDHPLRTGPPEFDPEHQRLAAWRSGVCGFCSHRIVWREAVTTMGVPTGMILTAPVLDALALSAHAV